jgi:PCFT/HCP family folate transporter-like MFS transporter 1/3
MNDSLPPPPIDGIAEEKNIAKKTPFHWHHVVDSLNVLVRPRDNNGRTYLIIFFFTIIAQQVCKSGETDTTLLFVEKSPLNWDKSLYGFLLATDYASLGIAVFLLLPILIRLLDLRDLTLILIGLFFKTIRLLLLSFSNKTWMVFLSVTIGCPSAMIISGSKSLISKSVNEDEMGKTFSLLSAGETVSNLLGTVFFTSIYSATFRVFPGLTFIMDAAFHAILLFMLICVAKDLKINSQVKLLQNFLGKKDTPVPNYGTTDDEYTPLSIKDDTIKLAQLREEDEEIWGKEDVEKTSDNITLHCNVDK